MPAYFMQQQGVDHSVIDKAIYTGGHDATALAVANGKVDAGAMDELVYGRMIKEGKLSESQVRVFYTTRRSSIMFGPRAKGSILPPQSVCRCHACSRFRKR